MSADNWRVVGAVILCLFIFFTGFRLSRSGKPYNQIIFNVHKLIALAGVVLFIVILVRTSRAVLLGPVGIITGAFALVVFLGLFITGALLSIEKPMPEFVSKLHHIMPYPAVLSTAATLYLLLR